MAKPFDAVLKVLVETEPEGWLPLVGRPRAPATAPASLTSSAQVSSQNRPPLTT